jgi:hypothetical protein
MFLRIESAGRSFFITCRTLHSGKACANTAATDTKFLTAASVSHGACAAYGGFGCALNAATFHVLARLQVTNFGLFKSAPNGVNYIDVWRLFRHNRFKVTRLTDCSQTFTRPMNHEIASVRGYLSVTLCDRGSAAAPRFCMRAFNALRRFSGEARLSR